MNLFNSMLSGALEGNYVFSNQFVTSPDGWIILPKDCFGQTNWPSFLRLIEVVG